MCRHIAISAIAISLVNFNLKAQQLNLSQLEKIRLLDDEQVNDYLAAKNWVFRGTPNSHSSLRGVACWYFRDAKSYGGYSAYLSISVDTASGERNMIYMTFNRMYYDAIRNQIIAKGFQKRSSQPRQEDCIETMYANQNYWISTGVCRKEEYKNSPVVYKITIQ